MFIWRRYISVNLYRNDYINSEDVWLMKRFIIILFISMFGLYANAKPVNIYLTKKDFTVDGKSTKIYRIEQLNGKSGFFGKKGQYFNVNVHNETNTPSTIHWHGLIDPNNEDGVPFVTQLPIMPGKSKHYKFKLVQAGTFWMHSHYGLQEAYLASAPLIIYNSKSSENKEKNIVIMLNDFSFRSPKSILYGLSHHKHKMDKGIMKPDLNDVHYPYMLANYKTANHAPIYHVKAGERVRLRFIDAATGSNFILKIPASLRSKAIATDGSDIIPKHLGNYGIAVGQRMDINVIIPKYIKNKSYIIRNIAIGTNQQSAVILQIGADKLVHVSNTIKNENRGFDFINQARVLHAEHDINHKIKINKTLVYKLTGSMNPYQWRINNQKWPHVTPYTLTKGDWYILKFINSTNMWHPMHLHGHVMKPYKIGNSSIQNGAYRDTIMIPPNTTEEVLLHANNPGTWLLHCHLLWHQASGMMTKLTYKNFSKK